jgi:excisionase family DNA binding protein
MAVERMAYNIRETAEALGLHPNTVYELISSGKLPACRLGRKILVSKLELSKWLVEQSNNTPPAAGAAAN